MRASVAGDQASTARILGLLAAVSPKRRSNDRQIRPPGVSPQTREDTNKARHSPEGLAARERSVLDRPYLKLSGRRHVPRLGCANGLPFLRIKKPQPPLLGRIFKYKILRKARWFEKLKQMDTELVRADLEDRWDSLVASVKKDGSEPHLPKVKRFDGWKWLSREPSWKMAIEVSIAWLNRRKASDGQERIKLAKRMTEIIWKEQALADKEEMERKKVKSAERWRRRRQRWKQKRIKENDPGEGTQSETSSQEYGQSEQTSPSDQQHATAQCSA